MAVSGVACRRSWRDESCFEDVQGARITEGSRYIVPHSWCRDYKGMSVKIRKCIRPVQCSSGARAHWHQKLVLMQLTREVSQCSSADSSECNGPESLKLKCWRIGSQYTLKAVKVALREQTVAVIKTRINDTHCNRFGSIECETWTDVASRTYMKAADLPVSVETWLGWTYIL